MPALEGPHPLQSQTSNGYKVVNSKKRKQRGASVSPEFPSKRQSTIPNYWLGAVEVSNPFSPLADQQQQVKDAESTSDPNNDTTINATPRARPPPIFVCKVLDINPLQALLEEVAKDNHSIKLRIKH
ncbi:hypothetical protein TKK_0015549 [Trichogramma kaykai]